MTSPQSQSYLIVGAGVFGVSTAYELIRKYPHASVTIVDRDAWDADTRVAASWDWNKVVRADYDDIIYCKLALEAQDIFENDPLYQPFFHKTGIFWICRSDYASAVVDNYKKLGRKAELSAVPVSEARKLYGGLFEDADYTGGVQDVLVNKTSGWANAGDALRAVTKRSIELGVKYVVADIDSLQFEEGGRCTGVKTTRGNSLTASHVVLCTGAFTAKLLEQAAQASGKPDISAGDRIIAGGIATGMTTLDEKSYERFAKMPVGVQGYNVATGPFIGSLPPTRDRELKWWGQKIFKNTQNILGRQISAPPNEPDYAQWKVSGPLKQDIAHANNVFYGKNGANWKMEKHRICWDAFTSSSDFIISPHAAAQGLYVATCGSFHGYKFFPVLGKYITQMLEGTLEPELQAKWGWDAKRPAAETNPDFPRFEMNDLLDSKARL
ncbi:FAD dependent oxidoreductase [Aaosphaeria arxii CBS 175.79]|uniref:FAD dependent oxidoreductase n=1 Tax=Aaosphaeria arxii CBS 175.79 TaxID=1450172 RepID=A0A6A5XD02_9PLEO|nr:FAD dependent oxidoreductase [Aaosphaeria arxii CBS 175.79]KAF2010686.1 FAD dependent oxidoreductase [Aaosphaeria arxii CBS 175.79]